MILTNYPKTVIVTGGAAASVYLAIIAITVINVTGMTFGDTSGIPKANPVPRVAAITAAPSATPAPPPATPPMSAPPAGAANRLSAARTGPPPPRLGDAALLATIRAVPQGVWAVDGSPDDGARQARSVGAGTLETLILYNIPQRDCGSYSAGGAAEATSYRSFVDGVARGIGGRAVRVVVEPDALGQCTAPERTALVAYAAATLQAAGARVYLDASQWVEAGDMAGRLRAAGIAGVSGFALNVSGYQTTASMVAYGRRVSALTGGKRFIIDTSRNGNGPKGNEWCNPSGRALGQLPTLQTGTALLDGLLWLKNPGESDGTCTEFGHHDPAAGVWWPGYALGLGRSAGL